MIESVHVDRFARMLFYTGATIMLGFIILFQVESIGSRPNWWNGGMFEALFIGMVFMVGAVAVLSLWLLFDGVATYFGGIDERD